MSSLTISLLWMVQSGIIGGLCLCSHRHAEANNKYVAKFISDYLDNFIVYIDCNNLYGFALCKVPLRYYIVITSGNWNLERKLMPLNMAWSWSNLFKTITYIRNKTTYHFIWCNIYIYYNVVYWISYVGMVHCNFYFLTLRSVCYCEMSESINHLWPEVHMEREGAPREIL